MDIEMIRFKCEFLALEILIVSIVQEMQQTNPTFAMRLRSMAQEATQAYQKLPVKDPSPEIADLRAAEMQEAWARLMQRVLL